MKKIKLYDYQQEMLDNIIKKQTTAKITRFRKSGMENEGNSVMVQMPTGTGKTYVMASVVKWFLDNHENGEVWIVAHRRELVEQMQQTLGRFCLDYGEKEMVMKTKVRIRVLSIQWLGRHIMELERAECRPGLIVVDEAHHALANSYQDLFVRNMAALKLGMTATPCRMKKESFGNLFERRLVSPSTKDFVRRGYLAPYDYVVMDSKTPSKTRQRMVEAFRNGELKCLVNVNLFDEGFDCPDVEYIQMARPTLSLAKYLQMVGRGLRINHQQKDKVCMIIDNVGNYRKFGLPDKERNWESMFAGLRAGKGTIPAYAKKTKGVIIPNNDMVYVAQYDKSKQELTRKQRLEYLQNVKPFESYGRWGLRVGDDVILQPVYWKIHDFVGGFAIFEIAPNEVI